MRHITAAVAVAMALAALPTAASEAAPRRRGSDPMREDQWGLAKVEATKAWSSSTGRGVIVAVLDTGIDLSHPDLKAKLVRGANFVDPNKPPQDDHGHGTHVAGVIAASTGNNLGVAGVAPDAKLMPVKVLDRSASGTVANVVAGIRYAADHGARVINLSLSVDAVLGRVATVLGQHAELHAAVEHARRKNVVVIAAAGNTTVPLCSEPAAAPNVVCVGALGPDDVRAWYSQGDATGSQVFVCAPGGAGYSTRNPGIGAVDDHTTNILSTVARKTPPDANGTGYVSMAGTSMASPHVAGVAALLVAKRLSARAVVERLADSATDLGPPGRDGVYGYGLVNAAAAVAAR